jgi:hypothetical protein
VTIQSQSQTPDLTCPLCGGPVATKSSGCRTCHLPISDIRRHRASTRTRRGGFAGALWTRIVGIVLYVGIVAWAWWQLPNTLPFVVPAAVIGGGWLHVVRGRPWWGVVVFAIIVVAVPVLLWPALGTGTFSELTDWR